MKVDRRMFVFAGPNGSGKSTVVDLFRRNGLCPKSFICPDQLVPPDKKEDENAYIRAMETAELTRLNEVALGRSFSFETVLSTENKLSFIKDAKAKNYFVTAIYVVTSDYNINLKRIAERVRQGGHNVPSDKVISRYERSMNLMFDVIMTADEALIYDNSGDVPVVVFQKDIDENYRCFVRSQWMDNYLINKAAENGIKVKM